jgi:glycosyltransferase involved in cell wall biosynthesis/tetratricopeptide (TPR) repeat protein
MVQPGKVLTGPYRAMSKATTADNRNPDTIVGFIDFFDESGLSGWAYSKDKPDQPISLTLWIDDKLIETIACGLPRPDVQNANHPSADVGFYMPLPRAYFDGVEHKYCLKTKRKDIVTLGMDTGTTPFRTFCFPYHFDAVFYTSFYLDVGQLGARDAYLHWSFTGKAESRFPNPDLFIADLERNGSLLPEDFSPALYRLLNQDIAGQMAADWQAILHYVNTGRAEGRPHGFSANAFVTDVYFSGEAPPRAGIEAFVAAHAGAFYTSLADMLARNGIASEAFLEYLNVSDYVTDNPEAGLRTRLQCVRHFAETGLQAGKPLSFDYYFDHGFVAELDPSYAEFSSVDAYRRWLNVGIPARLPPNGAAFLRNLGLTDVTRFPPVFDADLYRARNPDIAPLLGSRWAALRHCVESGIADGRQGCPITAGSCDIYRAAADRLAVAERLSGARKLYEMLLSEDPGNAIGSRHYGDCLLRQNEAFLAAQVYERIIADGNDNVWTHLNLTTCYITLSRWPEACRSIERIGGLRPGDRFIQRRHRDVMQQAYAALLAEANWLGANRFYAQARETVAKACKLLSGPLSSTLAAPSVAASPIRFVLIIADLGLPQCKFYRVDQKTEQLDAAGIGWKVINHLTDITTAIRECIVVDAVIFYRVPASPDVLWSLCLLRRAGIPIFFEIDDLMFDPQYFPPRFESYAGQITHDLYVSLVLVTSGFQACMAACDYAIASTPALADAMQSRVVSGRAFVHRNALGHAHARSYQEMSEHPARRKVRIFYGTGTKAHNEDFETNLARPLARLLREWGDQIELILMGYLVLPRVLRPFMGQIVMHAPVWDLRSYWDIVREMDISVAVLDQGLIADCKSEIKWLEAAMLGVPSVVTATRTYAEIIDDGKTGLLVGEDAGWYEQLNALVADRTRRLAIGAAAREVALARYATPAMAANLIDMLGAVTTEPARKRQKVLIVNVFFAPQSIGGATRVVVDNVRDILQTHGDSIELQVFCTFEGGAEAYLPLIYAFEGVRVTAIPTPLDPDIDGKLADERMAKCFAAVVDRYQPDLVHFHCIQRITLSACDVLRRKSIPYVITVHDGWWISDKQFLIDDFGVPQRYDYADPLTELGRGDGRRLERMKLKQTYLQGAQRILAVSHSFAAIYQACGFRNVVTVANGVSKLDILPRVPSPDGRVRMAHIGGASLHKGYNLVRAALFKGDFPNLHMTVIDHAMSHGERRYAVWGKTEVVLRGKFPQSNVAELYSQVDVLLAPSVWPECYGLVSREATLSGCWVVASDRGAIGADVDPTNGFVVDVGSPDALFAVFAHMNAEPEKYLSPAPPAKRLRTAAEQADDLVKIYRGTFDAGADAPPVREVVRPSAGRRKRN